MNIVAFIPLGGKGTRLNSITKEIPKPLYKVEGESTLFRCCKNLKTFGIEKVIFSIGFKSENFTEPIKEIASTFDLEIMVNEEKKPLGECGALWNFYEYLSEDFLFINGDLIFNLDFSRLINYHKRLASKLTLVTHVSTHPFDSDLVSVPNGSQIKKLFLKSDSNHKNATGFLGNSGIFIISKSIIKKIPPPSDIKCSSVFHHIVNKSFKEGERIYSYNTTEYIKDMGTPSRLKEVGKVIKNGDIDKLCYLNKQKVLFIDRDNTIIECKKGDYITANSEIVPISENIKSISNFAKNFHFVCLITNQPQISMGLISLEDLESIHSEVIEICREYGLLINVISFCPHHPHLGFKNEIPHLKRDCFCRKPNPGQLIEQAFHRNIDLCNSHFIGDSKTDEKAAELAGCDFTYVQNLK